MKEIYQPEEDSYLLSNVLEKEIPKILKETKNQNLNFLEIGCGSGINLETASILGIKKQNIFACDINKKAVDHCKNLGFNCIKSNIFQNIKGRYDIIIFNPPYLPEDENKEEPKSSQIATTGGKKGSEIINKFLSQLHAHSKKNTKIYIITSSLTKDIDFKDFKKTLIGEKMLFYEKIFCWRLEK